VKTELSDADLPKDAHFARQKTPRPRLRKAGRANGRISDESLPSFTFVSIHDRLDGAFCHDSTQHPRFEQSHSLCDSSDRIEPDEPGSHARG
jgi:hypothetical protein